MSWGIDFFTGKVYCGICKQLMKEHIDEMMSDDSKHSMLNKECFKNTSLFIDNYWHRYDKENGTMNTQFSSYCDDEEE